MAVSNGYARKIIRDIKKSLGKDKKKPVTIREFSEYMHLEYKEVLDEINGGHNTAPKASWPKFLKNLVELFFHLKLPTYPYSSKKSQ